MNEQVYNVAFKSALTEIKHICPDINESFILMDNGNMVALEEQNIGPNIIRALRSLQNLTENVESTGGLDDLLIDGEDGKVYVSRVSEMFFITALTKKADITHLRAITKIVLPTLVKVLESVSLETAPPPVPLDQPPLFQTTRLESTPTIVPEPIVEEENVEETEVLEKIEEVPTKDVQEIFEATEEETEPEDFQQASDLPSQQLIIDMFSGFLVRLDTVQIDSDILNRWSSKLDLKKISEVDVVTFDGKIARCKVKVIRDKKLEARGIIRIPEKLCDKLELKKGELVKVKPVLPESE
jgi:predicted regulator of Ras-like GTPase activity (Roadblock/LC7/MglB family)